MIFFWILSLFVVFQANVYAQDARVNASMRNAGRYTISGFMRDSLTTENLIDANVYNKINLAGTSTNAFGFYSITLPEGYIELVYSYVGYNTQTISFDLRTDTVIDVSLAGAIHLQELQITADRSSRIQETTQMSAIRVPMAQIKSMSAFFGEVDLLKVLQLMPGIQSGGEGNSGLYVRGGGPDQNLILLDGVPVYNASHLFGFFSVFKADAINNMEIYKGAFPARYGGRVSSVLDITMKEGNMQKFGCEGSIGLVSAKMTIEGPIIKDRTSFIVSGRRSYSDRLASSLIRLDDMQTDEGISYDYYFYDLTAKINHRFSANDRIYLSAYMGNDKYGMKDWYQYENDSTFISKGIDQGLKWGNVTAAFRWNHIFTNRLFSNTSVTYSNYRHTNWSDQSYLSEFIYSYPQDTVTRREDYEFLNDSGIRDWSAKITFDYLPSPDHYIRFGANAIYHTFDFGAEAYYNINEESDSYYPGIFRMNTWEYSAYAEDDVKLSERLKANVGLHWSAFHVSSKFYNVLQPRISARYLITPSVAVKAAYSRMAQYLHLLTNSGIGMSSDLWVPTTARLSPQISDQFVVGLAQNFGENYEISLEGYYKTMNNVIEYREGSGFFDGKNSWEQKVVQGEGRSYGMEIFIQKKTGSLTGWVGYTLSWTDRQFEALNNGKRFFYKYDRRHDISISIMKRFGRRIETSGVWVFGTGNRVTPPIAIYEAGNINGVEFENRYYDYGERNSFRMTAYHRLDLNIAYTFLKHNKWGEHKLLLGVYNAYNRKNPFYLDIENIGNRQGNIQYKFVQYSLFPVIPSISYQFKF